MSHFPSTRQGFNGTRTRTHDSTETITASDSKPLPLSHTNSSMSIEQTKYDIILWLQLAWVVKGVFFRGQNVKLGGHQTCLSINRLWHELWDMLRRLVGTPAPGHHDCSIQE
ncbi:hypothetical protein TNCV_3661651 [Trichonephila clavipes]|nr:hypothetical protein TNCV_3661651 [Trichonephila clavipes]